VNAAGVVLVTGGAGFIGSHVVDTLVARGSSVVVLDDLSAGRRENVASSARLEVMDLARPDVEGRTAQLRPDVIVHCAARTSVPGSFREPVRDLQANLLGSINLLRGAIAGGTRRFVYVTTGGALYGRPVAVPCTEEHPIQPLSPYGWTKYLVEEYLEMLGGSGFSWVALRLANVYGPRQRSQGEAAVVAAFVDRMASNRPIVIDGDGEQTRDFVYVGDVVEAVLAAIDSPAHGAINIGTGVGTSVNTLFETLASISGYSLEPQHGPVRPGDIRHSTLSSSRAARELAWQPRTPLEGGLERTYAALRGS
jgi:UDP-glucose 4-epimerase